MAFLEREPRLTSTFYFLSGWVKHISEDPMPNTPRKTVIGHYGLGDAQVTWLGMFNIGRRCVYDALYKVPAFIIAFLVAKVGKWTSG